MLLCNSNTQQIASKTFKTTAKDALDKLSGSENCAVWPCWHVPVTSRCVWQLRTLKKAKMQAQLNRTLSVPALNMTPPWTATYWGGKDAANCKLSSVPVAVNTVPPSPTPRNTTLT
eukprot:743966-Amphidinium_carterae.1